MTRPLEFFADIKNAVIVPPAYMMQFLKHCEGKQVRILLSFGLKKRTLKQNNYYKGIVVPQLAAHLRDQGCNISDDQADELIKRGIHFQRKVALPDGTVETLPRSTTECDTKEMSAITEQAIAYIADKFSFFIPLPQQGADASAA